MTKADTIPDLCVIGASEAGLAVCLGAVAIGLSCVLVDDGDASGRNNPDLVLSVLAEVAADPRLHSTCWERLKQALERGAADRRLARFSAMNVRIIRGTGRFTDARTLVVDETAVRARRFVIATGGEQPAWQQADGLAAGVRLSLADVGRLSETPRSLLVIGDGPAAVSAAQSFTRLGAEVTLVAERPLPGFDPELVAPLLAQLRRDGVVLAAARLQRLYPTPDGCTAELSDGRRRSGTHLLLAEGTRPTLRLLDLGQANVAVRDDRLALDRQFRTSQPHILAIGRAAGARSSQEGVAQAGHVLRTTFLRLPGHFRADVVSVATCTQPEIATVGHFATHARSGGIWRWPLAQTAAATISTADNGLLKLCTDRRGRIVGAGLVGRQVRDQIAFWSLGIARGATLAELAPLAVPPGSWSEAGRALAAQSLGQRLASPWARRALRALRRLG